MAIHNLNRESLDYHKGCFDRLRADTRPEWGRLTPEGLCSHLSYFIGFTLGDDPHPEVMVPRPLQPVMRWLFFEVMTTWPKGKIVAPPFMTPPAGEEFEREREKVLTGLDRFVQELATDPTRTVHSPAFGTMPLSYWSRIHGVHLNHHYRQFGLLP